MRGGRSSPTVEAADEPDGFGALLLDEGLDSLPGPVRQHLVDSPCAYLRDRGELEPHVRSGLTPMTTQEVASRDGQDWRKW